MIDLSLAVGYCRVSSEGQARFGHGLESYIARLKDFGLDDPDIYFDIESGSNLDRAGFQTVLDLVRSGKKLWVVVPSFDRFSRLDPATWEGVMAELRHHGAAIYALDAGLMKFDTPDEKYIARLQAIGAAREKEKIKWRVEEGYKHAREMGRAYRSCFGWALEEGKLVPNTDEYRDSGKTCWEIAREIGERFMGAGSFAGGYEVGSVDRLLKSLNQTYGAEKLVGRGSDFPRDWRGLRDWLLNECHQGHVVYSPKDKAKKRIAWNADPDRQQLFTEIERSTIEALLKNASRIRTGKEQIRNPLAGLIYCAGCGSKVIGLKAGNGKYRYLFCSGAHPKNGKPRTCDRRSSYSLKVDDADQAVIVALIERAHAIKMAYGAESSIPDPVEAIELRAQIEKLEALGDPDLQPVIQSKYGKLIQIRETQLKRVEINSGKLQALVEICSKKRFWELMTIQEKQMLYLELVERVEIDRGKITVALQV